MKSDLGNDTYIIGSNPILRLGLEAFAKAMYCQPYRHYHNWAHIEHMLVAHDTHFGTDIPDRLWLAIVFHDAIYVPGVPKDVNEIASAALVATAWRAVVREPIPESLHRQVTQLIMATTIATHLSRQRRFGGVWGTVLRDLDLLALASGYNEFLENQFRIRKELGITPEQHASFLKMMLARRSTGLFLTSILSHLNPVAANNIRQYIILATKGDIE